MELLLNIIGIFLSVIGVIILIRLRRYIKLHANEELEMHKEYIFSRFVAIAVLGVGAAVLNLVGLCLCC